MTSKQRAIEEHDVVRFLAPIDRWPAGTKGTVVDTHPQSMLVEISDSWGAALDFVAVPIELLEVTWSQALQAAV